MTDTNDVTSRSTTTDTATADLSVTARFFAAAEEAVGAAELVLELPKGATIRAALSHAGGESAMPVLSRCTFLVNSEATTDIETTLKSGDLLDVLPPFAGG